jgi:hypothetical protein
MTRLPEHISSLEVSVPLNNRNIALHGIVKEEDARDIKGNCSTLLTKKILEYNKVQHSA